MRERNKYWSQLKEAVELLEALESLKRKEKAEAAAAIDRHYSAQRQKLIDQRAEVEELFRAERQRIDAEVAASVKDKRIGRRVVQWSRQGSWGLGPWRKTGKLGIVEVIGPAQGEVRFSTIGGGENAGDLCVREVLKGGKFGKWAHAFLHGKLPYGWCFEGEEPKR